MMCLFVLLLVVAAAAAADQTVTKLPLRYSTVKEETLGSFEKAVYQVYLDCPLIINSRVEVCAELPNNWPWDQYHGFVYLNIFDNVRNIDNLTAAINSTGQPHHGEHVPEKCITINKWPGGDLFVRVDSNNYNPVVYTLGVIVTPPTLTTDNSVNTASKNDGAKAKRPAAFRDGDITVLVPALTPNKPISFIYDEAKTFQLDLCLQYYPNTLEITTTLLSAQGTFTHFICDAMPCGPDARSVICSVSTPYPVHMCTADVPGRPEALYINVHSAEGVYNSTSKSYMSSVLLGASFSNI